MSRETSKGESAQGERAQVGESAPVGESAQGERAQVGESAPVGESAQARVPSATGSRPPATVTTATTNAMGTKFDVGGSAVGRGGDVQSA